jgi:hypothetical protein
MLQGLGFGYRHEFGLDCFRGLGFGVERVVFSVQGVVFRV